MRNLGWLVVLLVCGACDALSFEGNLFPTEGNARNCVSNPAACAEDEVCDRVRKRCVAANGTCASSVGCLSENAAFCNAGICIGCNALDAAPEVGDQRCADWTTQRGGTQKLCIAGACKECRSNADCTQPGKMVCDQVKNTCVGCVIDSDCAAAGSMICRTDESLLGTGELRTKLGECVDAKDVAYVKYQLGSCSDIALDAGSPANPYCQIQTAIAKGKSFIRVLSGGADYSSIQVNANSQQRVFIYGPGQQNANVRSATVSNGAWLTLQDIEIKQADFLPAVLCDTNSQLIIRRILINGDAKISNGVRARECSKVTIERTKIDMASGYGIWISGGSQHRVINTAITRSGNFSQPTGLRIDSGVVNAVIAFNTITSNVEGIRCESNQLVTDSIIQGNYTSNISGCSTVRVVTMGAMIPDVSMSGADPRVTGDSMTMPVVVDKGMQLPPSVPPVTEDYYGNPRPAGGGLDIGFHEYR